MANTVTLMAHPARPFTLHELCPHCNEANPPTTVFSKPRCTHCKETKERVRAFATREELLAYVANLPPWAG